MYLDNFGFSNAQTYSQNVFDNYASGVRVLVHEHGTMPDMAKGFNIAPGRPINTVPYLTWLMDSILHQVGP